MTVTTVMWWLLVVAALSSDLSAAQAAFIETLDLRARTPRSLASAQAVKVPIGKKRGLRDFLRSSASARPGALGGRMKARAEEARRQAQKAQQKEAKAQQKEEARLAAETQRRAREEAARVAAEDAAAARSSAGLPAMQLELKQMRATARVVGAQYKTKVLNVMTVRLKLSGEGTLVRRRLAMP